MRLEQIEKDVAEIKVMIQGIIDGKTEYTSPGRRLSIAEVGEVVSMFLNVPLSDMQGDRRILHIARARQLTTYIAVNEFMHTHGEAAAFFNVTRTNSYAAIKSIDKQMYSNRKWSKLYKFCMEEIVKRSKQ